MKLERSTNPAVGAAPIAHCREFVSGGERGLAAQFE
jgi:hypothetical protein